MSNHSDLHVELDKYADAYLDAKLNQPISRSGLFKGLGAGALAIGFGGGLGALRAPAATAAPLLASTTTIKALAVVGYADAQVTAPWRKKNDVKVVEQGAGSNEEFIAKLAAGGTRIYDLVSPNVSYVPNMVPANLLQPLDYSRISGSSQLLPALRRFWASALVTDGEPYGMPFIWGDSPMMVNRKYLKGALPQRWMDLKAPRFKKSLFMVDDPTNNITCWSRALGFNPKTLTKDQLKQVVNFLVKFKRTQVRTFGGTWNDVVELMLSGDILAVCSGGWSAAPEFINQKGGKAVSVYAKEGDFVWTDSWAIPKDAPNPDLAYSFIDYMTSPKPQAALASKLLSGTVNAQAVKLLKPKDLKLNNYKQPGKASKGILYLPPPKTNTSQASLNDWYKAWQTVKAA